MIHFDSKKSQSIFNQNYYENAMANNCKQCFKTHYQTATPLPKAYDCVAVYIAGRRTNLVVYGWQPKPPTKKFPAFPAHLSGKRPTGKAYIGHVTSYNRWLILASTLNPEVFVSKVLLHPQNQLHQIWYFFYQLWHCVKLERAANLFAIPPLRLQVLFPICSCLAPFLQTRNYLPKCSLTLNFMMDEADNAGIVRYLGKIFQWKEVNWRLTKHPLVFNGRLANRRLTSLVKEATDDAVNAIFDNHEYDHTF